MKKMNYRGILQSVKYILLAVLFLILIFAFANMGWGTNTQGCNCDANMWHGDEIIGRVSTDIYFQGMWDDMPCRWTGGYYFGFYIWTILLYSIFKHFGSEILRKPVPLKINLTEFIIAWGIYLYGLLDMVSKRGIDITPIVFYNAGIGTFLLIAPMLGIILMVSLLRRLKI